MPVWPLQKDCNAFYGNPGNTPAQWAAWEGEHLVEVKCPWQLYFIEGQHKQSVADIRIHKLCAASLTTVLGNIWDSVGKDPAKITALHYDRYSGSYNQRPMRGGSARSMHGYGAALDIDAEENAQHDEHGLFTPTSLITIKFEAEGWVWGGRWSVSSVDKMHYQAARIHP